MYPDATPGGRGGVPSPGTHVPFVVRKSVIAGHRRSMPQATSTGTGTGTTSTGTTGTVGTVGVAECFTR